ncbi:MAG: 5-methylcytosine-specific restriction endonuclease system specificity protein McrC [Bacteroidales bacterium]|nr:5-methylcytosine-specific restriction endonuclease system specificity protein McrC [Bacteroidales bacterium]
MGRNDHVIVKNIYYMLCYTLQILRSPDYEEFSAEEFPDMQNLFAKILSVTIGKQIKRGLYREYLGHTDDMPVLRGKIDMRGTMRHEMAKRELLSCEFDELSVNNLLNQIIKTAVQRLVVSDKVDGEYKKELKKEMLYFSGVSELDPGNIPWSAVRFHRNNQSYYMLIYVCRFLLEDVLMATEKDGDVYRLNSFIDDGRMYDLYEKFVYEYFRRHFPSLKPEYQKELRWALDDEGSEDILPIMRPDITLTAKDGSKVLFIDTKYYSQIMRDRWGTRGRFHSGNLYQIYSYVKNKRDSYDEKSCPEVAGILLYARTDEQNLEERTFPMKGNDIGVLNLDLNREFPEIAGKLNSIVRDSFGLDMEREYMDKDYIAIKN